MRQTLDSMYLGARVPYHFNGGRVFLVWLALHLCQLHVSIVTAESERERERESDTTCKYLSTTSSGLKLRYSWCCMILCATTRARDILQLAKCQGFVARVEALSRVGGGRIRFVDPCSGGQASLIPGTFTPSVELKDVLGRYVIHSQAWRGAFIDSCLSMSLAQLGPT